MRSSDVSSNPFHPSKQVLNDVTGDERLIDFFLEKGVFELFVNVMGRASYSATIESERCLHLCFVVTHDIDAIVQFEVEIA